MCGSTVLTNVVSQSYPTPCIIVIKPYTDGEWYNIDSTAHTHTHEHWLLKVYNSPKTQTVVAHKLIFRLSLSEQRHVVSWQEAGNHDEQQLATTGTTAVEVVVCFHKYKKTTNYNSATQKCSLAIIATQAQASHVTVVLLCYIIRTILVLYCLTSLVQYLSCIQYLFMISTVYSFTPAALSIGCCWEW